MSQIFKSSLLDPLAKESHFFLRFPGKQVVPVPKFPDFFAEQGHTFSDLVGGEEDSFCHKLRHSQQLFEQCASETVVLLFGQKSKKL